MEDQEHLCRTEEMNITSVDIQRMILIAGGMKDHTLAEMQLRRNTPSSRSSSQTATGWRRSYIKEVSWINCFQADLEDVMKIRKRGL